MAIMTESKMRLQRLGGSFQLDIRTASDIKHITKLHPARWAATSAAIDSLNCDPRFLELLDTDQNGRIRSDEIVNAINWLVEMFKSTDSLKSGDGSLNLTELSETAASAQTLTLAASAIFPECGNKITLENVRNARKTITDGALKGNGVITAMAFKHTAAEPLAQLVIKSTGGIAGADKIVGITALLLDGFIERAAKCLKQAKNLNSENSERKNLDNYVKYRKMHDKIDEYFSYCRLIQLEPARLAQFCSNTDAMTPLDTKNSAAVNDYLNAAPLAFPTAAMTLDFNGKINPGCQAAAAEFSTAFAIGVLTAAEWEQLKNAFADYEEYLNASEELTLSDFCWRELSSYLSGSALIELRALFNRDTMLNKQLCQLNELEKLILCKQHFLKFTRNFISFSELFSPEHQSMIQAGTLILDGRCFDLTIKIKDIQEHKKLAAKCNIYTLYMELKRKNLTAADPAQINCSMLIAAAVTEGTCSRIYAGKPGIFIGWDGSYWDGKIIEIVPGPVSLWQSLLLPITNLNNFLFNKLEKFTSLSNLQQTLDKSLSNAAPAAGKPGGLIGGGSLLVLCGGVGLAAVGSSVAFIIKSLAQISALKLICWIVIILLLISLPPVIAGIYKLRRRNLGLFLEAAGWAVNLPLRLGTRAGRLFTGVPRYPEHAQLIELEQLKSLLKTERFQTRCSCNKFPLITAIVFTLWVLVMMILHYYPF
jgi:hypothetical protein